MTEPLDNYPVIDMEGVEPIFVRAMMIGNMAARYSRAASLTISESYPHAVATWNTDWPADPAPRTFEAAMEAVDSDLDYWEGE